MELEDLPEMLTPAQVAQHLNPTEGALQMMRRRGSGPPFTAAPVLSRVTVKPFKNL
jgi:hypothetical protein